MKTPTNAPQSHQLVSICFGLWLMLSLSARAQTLSYDPIQIRVAPGLSYIKTNEFPAPPVGKTNTLNLVALDILRGDKFQLRTLGSFATNDGTNEDGSTRFGPEVPQPFLGVFASVFTSFRGNRQTAGPQVSGLPGYVTPDKLVGGNPVPTDTPEDFLIPPGGVTVQCVPVFGNFLGLLNPDPNAIVRDNDTNFVVEILPLEKARPKLIVGQWNPTNPVVGDTVTLTLIVTNLGNVPVQNLSADRTPYPTTPGVMSLFYRTNLMDYLSGPTPLSYASIPPGGSGEFHYTFLAKAPGTNTLARFDTDKIICDNVRVDAFHEWLVELVIGPGDIIVNSTGDEPDADLTDNLPDVDLEKDGLQTTLRCAIDFANRRPGKDAIKFKIEPEGNVFEGGVPVIRPKTNLVEITDPLVIDGWSQNPGSETPSVHLNGFDDESGAADCLDDPLPSGANYSYGWPCHRKGLVVRSDGCEIRGLCISQFYFGLALLGGNNVVQGCFLGTDPSGTRPMANAHHGYGQPAENGYSYRQFHGCNLLIRSSGNLIGGLSRRLGNLVSGQGGYLLLWESSREVSYLDAEGQLAPGILIDGPASGNVIQGNIIGLDRTGTRRMSIPDGLVGNRLLVRQVAGIYVYRGSDNLIGGSEPGAGNVISGNRAGIILDGESVQNNRIEGNLIGTDITGTLAIGNDGTGISVQGTGNLIGGLGAGAGNVIAANETYGIILSGAQNLVRGNRIGLASSEPSSASQSYGVFVSHATGGSIIGNQIGHDGVGILVQSSTNNLIAGNQVVSNRNSGIWLANGQANRIITNSIVGNGYDLVSQGLAQLGLGIDLLTLSDNMEKSGVNLNDDDDRDEGPNRLQNHPSINRVTLLALSGAVFGRAAIIGALRTTPEPLIGNASPYRIEFYVSKEASPTGYGEGEFFLGAIDVLADVTGLAPFEFETPTLVGVGQWIAATATDSQGNTSEFSKAVQVSTQSDDDGDGICNELEAGVPNPGGGLLQHSALQPAALNDPPPSGDGNGDGIADSAQTNVCSLIGLGGKWLTLAVRSSLTLGNVQPGGPPEFDIVPSGYAFPLGFVRFTLTGLAPAAAATVTNIFHDAVELTTVFAYGPTPGQPQPHWYELSPDFTGNELRLTFTDGAAGDHDLAANGTIPTIYAPAYLIPPGPTLSLLSTTTRPTEEIDFIELNGQFTLTTNAVQLVTSVLAWPASATNYVLQSAGQLSPTNVWRNLLTEPTVAGSFLVLTNSAIDGQRFYRLRRF